MTAVQQIKPMLTTLVKTPFTKKGWVFEIKWDGYRAIAHVQKNRNKNTDSGVLLYSRRGLSFNQAYPSIVNALQKIRHTCILDGEVVMLNDRGQPDFQLLQNKKFNEGYLVYEVFDLLFVDGKDIKNKPLMERKKILQKILPKNSVLRYSDHIEEKGEAFFKKTGEAGLEGIIAKKASSVYRVGARTMDWLKIKRLKTQDAVICGFTKSRGARKWFGALVLGVYEKNGESTLKYIGHSGSGFTEESLKNVYEMLQPLKSAHSPFREKISVNAPVTWVRPRIVCEIKFQEWTQDGIMRQPVFLGIRADKKAAEVFREVPFLDTYKINSGKDSETSKVLLTNLDKIYWPREGYTKGDLVEYYRKIAPIILPYLRDRPESLNRHPNGIEKPSFFHKNITTELPPFVQTHIIHSESEKKDMRYIVCQNKETLLYLANLGCIELNPWNSRIESLHHPDYMIFDLDPGETTMDNLVKVAQVLHKTLDDIHIANFCKTSGKRGLHVCIPLQARYSYDTVRQFAELLARVVHTALPKITSVERAPSKRTTKIYIDFLQNRRAQTLAAPYSVRPWRGATVSTPLEWKEVKKGLDPGKWNIKTIFRRLEKKGDLWKLVLREGVDLKKAIERLQ